LLVLAVGIDWGERSATTLEVVATDIDYKKRFKNLYSIDSYRYQPDEVQLHKNSNEVDEELI